jgi:hypothetical protein
MARFTSAYSSFLERLDEVELLRRFAMLKERKNPVLLRNEINALSRGALVLLSSHLEAYIKELGELALDSLYKYQIKKTGFNPAFFYHISKDFIDQIKDTSDPEKIGEKIFAFLGNDLSFWDVSSDFSVQIPSDRFNGGFSNPSYKKIRAYINRFGYTDFQRDLCNALRADFQPVTNMIDHLVDVRNKIAHGDPIVTKTPHEVKDIVRFVKCFCSTTDALFATWWRQRHCPIR